MVRGDIAQLKAAEARATTLISAARDERKAKLRQALTETKKEIDEYRAQREVKLRATNPEAQALDARVARVTAETDRSIAALEAEYGRNKEAVLKLLMEVTMNVSNPHAA